MYMPPREGVPAAVEAEGRPRLRTRRRSMRMARQRRKQSFSSTSSANPNDNNNNNNNNNNGMAGPSNTNKNQHTTNYSQSQHTPQQHYHNHHTQHQQMPHQHQHQHQQHQQHQQQHQNVQHSQQQQQNAQYTQQQNSQGRGGQRHIKNAERTRHRSPSPKHTPPPTPPSPSRSHKSQSQQSQPYQHSTGQQHHNHHHQKQCNPSTPSPISLVINLGNDLLATRQEVEDLKKKQKQSGNICSWSNFTRVMVLLSSVAVSLFVSKALGVSYNFPGQNPFFTDQNGPGATGGPSPGQGQQFQGQGQGFQSSDHGGFNSGGGQGGQQWSGCQDPSFKRVQKPEGGYTCVKKSVSEHCSGYFDNQGGQRVWKCCPQGQSYQYDENAQKGACCQDHDVLSVDRMNGNKVSCCPQGTQYQFNQQIGKGSCCGYGHAFSVDPNTRTGFCCPITHYWDGNTCRVGQNPNVMQGGDSMMTGQFKQGQHAGNAGGFSQQMNEQNMHAHHGHGMHHQSVFDSGMYDTGAQGAAAQGVGAQGMGMFESGAQGTGLYGTGMEGNMQDGSRMGMRGNAQGNLQGNLQDNMQGVAGGMLQGQQENIHGQAPSGNFGEQQQQLGQDQQRFGNTDRRGQYPEKSGQHPDTTGSTYYRGYRHWREDPQPPHSWCRARKVCPKNCHDLGLKYGHCYTITYPDGQALNRAANGEYHKGADYIDDITFRVCDTNKNCAYTNKPVTRSDGFILRDEKGVPLKDAKGWVYSLSYAAHFNFMADEEATAANVKVATEVAIGIVPFIGKPSCMGDGCSICLNTMIKRSRGVGPVCPVEGNKMPAFGTLINSNMCQRFIFHEVRCDDQPCPNTSEQNTGRTRGGVPQQQQQQRQAQFGGQQQQQGGYPSGQANFN